MKRPTVVLTFITRNDYAVIGPMLESVIPHVDEVIAVDTGSTDGTQDLIQCIAHDYRVPCTVLDFAWCDDFAAARNFGCDYVKAHSACDWVVWFDTDDTLENPETVFQAFANLTASAPDVTAVQLAYHYAFDEHGNCVVEHLRERFLRKDIGWTWVGAIHEYLKHPEGTVVAVLDIGGVHHRRQEIPESPARDPERNLRILEAKVRTDPTPRTLVYLGHEYMVRGQIERARDAYKAFLEVSDWDEERGQVLCRLGDMALAEGNPKGAQRFYTQALVDIPTWPDPYLRMAQSSLMLGQDDRALYWLGQAETKEVPDTQLILNPLEYRLTPALVEGQICLHKGDYAGACGFLKQAMDLTPTAEVTALYQRASAEREALQDAEAVARVFRFFTPDQQLKRFEQIPLSVATHPDLQTLMASHPDRPDGSRPSVAFFAGPLGIPWNDRSLETGLGGTETAVVHVSRRLAAMGWDVSVYGEPGNRIGRVDSGVTFLPAAAFDLTFPFDHVVSVRHPEMLPQIMSSAIRHLWLHDVSLGNRITEETMAATDRYWFVSDWQRDQYIRNYGVPMERSVRVPNGIDETVFAAALVKGHRMVVPEKHPHRFVWTSSPDRGLEYVFSLWPCILERTPDATLDIFYGWDLYDAHGGDPRYKAALTQMGDLPGVTWRGRVGQKALYKELYGAGVWLYPGTFNETHCITALEMLACGVYPIVNANGALPTTLNGHGTVIKGSVGNPDVLPRYLDAYDAYCARLTKDPEGFAKAGRDAAAYALSQTWDKTTDIVAANLKETHEHDG